MPDITPDQTPTAGQLLAGTPPNTGNMPLYARAGTPPSLPGQPPAQQPQPQPSPLQAVDARHYAMGQAATFLFGQQHDPETGQPVKQRPGDVFRSLLAGALLGSALGSQSNAGGGSVGSFLGGMGRGGAAVKRQAYQRQQQAFDQSQRKHGMSLEDQKFAEEKVEHTATLERWNITNLLHGREADYKDREQLEKENEVALNVQKWAIDNGAVLAPSLPQNGVRGNGPSMMRAMIKNPAAFNPPAGTGRLIVKKYDFDHLDHDTRNGWTEDW